MWLISCIVSDDSDRDTDESEGRGFRPRLARVREDPGQLVHIFSSKLYMYINIINYDYQYCHCVCG